MFCMVSSFFCVLYFPHEGKIITIDQLAFFSSGSLNGNVPYMGNTNIPYESMGAGLFKDSPSMGAFSLPPLHVASVNMIQPQVIYGSSLLQIRLIFSVMLCR